MNKILHRGLILLACLLVLLGGLATGAGAAQASALDQNQQVYLPGSTLPGYLQNSGAQYQGQASLQLAGTGDQLAAGQTGSAQTQNASSTYWWYISSGHYNILMPGTAQGPYASYYYFGLSLSPYLGESYDAATRLLGVENQGYGNISLWLTYDSGNSSIGWYYAGSSSNSIYLNTAFNYTSAYFGSIAAHETTHLILDHRTNLFNRDTYGSNWYSEALAYYVGNSVYAYGDGDGYSYNASLLKRYSQNGAQRSSWYDSGARYLNGDSSTFDWVQLNVIGYFLGHSNQGWSAIQSTVRGLMSNRSLESSLQSAYGMDSGMYSTDSGAGVNTLYSNYIYYYLGHY